ncbi:MAG TPA: murein biosynthesis integral membrane protein MurJ [Candidatus Omnitrophota bacterium]|nr:murein biosynthesis integral membrane protein MurJ [Candidatus Omnitrophota bacterium]
MTMSSSVEKSGDNVTRGPHPVNEVPKAGFGKKSLVRAAVLVSAMTLLGRVLGLIRDILSAKTFGTRWQWDAFIYAFMIPNLFRRIVGEGGLTSAFIPVYNETKTKQGVAEAFRFANVTLCFLACALLVFVIAVQGLITAILAAGHYSEMLTLTLNLLRILFPYLWFLSLYALGMGILNSHGHFLAPSLGSVILDGVWIFAILWVPSWVGTDYADRIRWLTYTLLFAGFLHVAVEIPPLWKIGFRFKFIWDLAHEGLKKTWKLLLPVVMSFAVVQINITVDATLGLVIGPGANSSLWYGNRLMQFPLGIFALAMGTALLPMLSQQIASGEREAAKRSLSFALRSVFFIIIPSSVGLIVFREEIIRFLFERGEFDPVSTARSAAVLLGYTIGLFAYSGQKIMAAGYYAAHDTKTPMRTALVSLFLNIVLNLILMIPLKEAGLALATSISGIVQFGQLIYYYPKKVGEFPFREIARSFFRILLASAAMAGICYASLAGLRSVVPGTDTLAQGIQVLGSILIAIISYLALCFLFRVPEIHEAVEWIRKKRKRK